MAKEEISNTEKLGFVPARRYKRIREDSLCLSFGILPLDFATGEIDNQGYAGIRQRDLVEVCGLNNSLKTAVGISMLGATQKRFGPETAIAIFTEPPDPYRLEQAGVDLDGLKIYDLYDYDSGEVNSKLAESALNAALKLMMEEENIYNVLIDSVAACVPESLFYDTKGKNIRDVSENPVAAMAKVFNNFVAKYKLVNRKSVLTLINHRKVKVATDGRTFEDRTKIETPAGRGMEFMADVRIECQTSAETSDEKHSSSLVDGKLATGFKTTWTLFKNKYANKTGSRIVRGYFDFKEGRWNNEEALIEIASFFAVKEKTNINPNRQSLKVSDNYVFSDLDPIVYKNVGSIRIGDESFKGIANAARYLIDNPMIYEKLVKQVYPLHDQFFLDERPTADSILEN